MQKDTIDILTGEIKEHFKPGPGGRKYRYVKGEDVISRLNSAFKHEWSSKVEQILEKENQIIILVSIEAEGTSHQGFGGADIAVYKEGPRKGQPVDISNSYKSAFTNALKKAAEQFGVGLLSEDEFVPTSIQEEVTLPTHNAPPAPESAPKTVSSSAVISTAVPSNIEELFKGVDLDELQRQVESSMVESKAKETKSLAASFKEPVESVPHNTQPSFSPSGADDDKINDIQLNALKALTKLKKITSEEAIRQGLGGSSKASYETLTRAEARNVLKVLNKLDQSER
jgi:hypothetical protein